MKSCLRTATFFQTVCTQLRQSWRVTKAEQDTASEALSSDKTQSKIDSSTIKTEKKNRRSLQF